MGNILQIMFLIIMFCVIIFLTYYSTKLIAGAKIKSMKNTNMEIIETITIGFGHIHIVKANKQYFLISQTKAEIRILSEIDGEGLKIKEKIQHIPFEKYFKNSMKKGEKDEKDEK